MYKYCYSRIVCSGDPFPQSAFYTQKHTHMQEMYLKSEYQWGMVENICFIPNTEYEITI